MFQVGFTNSKTPNKHRSSNIVRQVDPSPGNNHESAQVEMIKYHLRPKPSAVISAVRKKESHYHDEFTESFTYICVKPKS